MNPVRANIVADPGDYLWSSFREKTQGLIEVIDLDQGYISLGADDETRRELYHEAAEGDILYSTCQVKIIFLLNQLVAFFSELRTYCSLGFSCGEFLTNGES